MNPIRLLLVSILLLTSCSGSQGGAPTTPEAASRLLMEAFRQNDFEACEAMLMTAEDLEWVVDRMRGSEREKSMEYVSRFDELGAEAMLAEERERLRSRFLEMRQEGEGESVPWGEIRFLEVHDPKERKIEGVDMVQFYIRFESSGDGRMGEIKMNAMFRTPRGLVMESIKS